MLSRRAPAAATHNLPAELSSFVGREHEIAEIAHLVTGTRLVTLTGPAGVGKTRAALQIARAVADDFSDGVWLVELASLVDATLVPHVVAAALNLKERVGQPVLATLANALAESRLLLVLDNCEHLVLACAELAEYLLHRCPDLVILTTSREPLGIPGEHVWPLPPLTLPPTVSRNRAPDVDATAAAESVQLFVDRVSSTVPGFTLAADNAAAVAEVCTRLDGIPLAIELAAARSNILSPEQLAARLDGRLGLLVSGNRTASPRQRTLRAAVEWSYSLLSPEEQRLFNRLSVFAGGWTLEAAEAIGGDDGQSPDTVLTLLAQLSAKSLVVVEPRASGESRYRLLVMLQEYGWERLLARDEADALRDRHADYFLAFAERAEPLTWTAAAADWWARLEADIDNIRVALRWLIEQRDAGRGLRLGAALMRFWQTQNYFSEGRSWLAQLLDLPRPAEASPSLAMVFAGAGQLASTQGDYAIGRPLLEHGLALGREAGDARVLTAILHYVGQMLWWAGDFDGARTIAAEGVELARATNQVTLEAQNNYLLGGIAYETGDYLTARSFAQEALRLWSSPGSGYVRGIAIAYQQLGRVTYREGDLKAARKLMEESIATFKRGAAWPFGIGWDLITLGWIATDSGDRTYARNCLTEAVSIFRDLGAGIRILECVEAFAYLAVAEQQWDTALRLGGAAAAARTRLGVPATPGDAVFLDAALHRARGKASAGVWVEGQTMTVDEAAIYALASLGDAPDPGLSRAGSKDPLTTREREVAELVARGLTSRQIAEELVIAERTAETHLEHIYAKLGVRTRAQLTRWMLEFESRAAASR